MCGARVFAVATAIAVSATGCNALTGIDDYSVGPSDAAAKDAPADGGARDGPAGDAPIGDAGNHAPVSAGTCAVAVGSAMTQLTDHDGGVHCIDDYEVTVYDYAGFLADRGATNTSGQPAECSWNTTYAPSSEFPGTNELLPRAYVDWCDAYMFCRWAGKVLCGALGGGAVPIPQATIDETDEWFRACGDDQGNTYPYGATYSSGLCADGSRGLSQPIQVGSAMYCNGSNMPFDKVFDMSGNVAEWEDSCSASAGASDTCLTRGGSYADDAGNLTCAAVGMFGRNTQDPRIGFRCCVP